MLDCLDEIESDLSRFHRVDDPQRLASSRYFLLVEQLVHYGGAVTAFLAAQASAAPVAPDSGGGPVALDVRTVASLTADSAGFPGIEYSGG